MLQTKIDDLLHLHDAIVQALDAGDLDRVDELVHERGSHVTVLADAFNLADESERQQLQPTLERLAGLDQKLQARCRAARDTLGSKLAELMPAPTTNQGQIMSGVFDRHA